MLEQTFPFPHEAVDMSFCGCVEAGSRRERELTIRRATKQQYVMSEKKGADSPWAKDKYSVCQERRAEEVFG